MLLPVEGEDEDFRRRNVAVFDKKQCAIDKCRRLTAAAGQRPVYAHAQRNSSNLLIIRQLP